jgi:hypothetical protein
MDAAQAEQLIQKLDEVSDKLSFISLVLFRWDNILILAISFVLVFLICSWAFYILRCFTRF